MRAEDEKIRIEKARAALLKLAQGFPLGMLQIFDGPVAEWQLRLAKRLQRESMISTHAQGYHANSIRMVNMLKAAAANTPAVVELLWPERAKDVLKGLARLAPVAMLDPVPAFDANDAAGFARAVVPWTTAREPGRWYRVKDLLPIMPAGRLFPKEKSVNEQWIMLGQLLSSGARRLQTVDGYIVERRNGPSGTEYRLIRKAADDNAYDDNAYDDDYIDLMPNLGATAPIEGTTRVAKNFAALVRVLLATQINWSSSTSCTALALLQTLPNNVKGAVPGTNEAERVSFVESLLIWGSSQRATVDAWRVIQRPPNATPPKYCLVPPEGLVPKSQRAAFLRALPDFKELALFRGEHRQAFVKRHAHWLQDCFGDAFSDVIDTALAAAAPGAEPAPVSQPEPVPPVESPVIAALREHGPTTKRDLQDKIGGKRQIAQQTVEDALDQGLCLFGHLPSHARARVYLQEHLDAIEAAVVETEPEVPVANATEGEAEVMSNTQDDDVDDYTFKSTTLKYIVIYGQNFIAVAEHFRLLHETTARLETKLDALLERLEKRA